MASESGTLADLARPLSTASYDDILHAHSVILLQKQKDILLSGQEVADGIWLSRNVSLHPTAQLTPPVYIGENCQIGKGVQLGPLVTINKDCVIDSHSTVSNAVIFPGSYVGEALELTDVVVDNNRLVNVRLGIEVPIVDDFLLGNLSSGRMSHWLLRPLSQGMACMGLMATAPMLLATALWLKLTRPGTVFHQTLVVALPAPNEPARWRTFRLLSFAPPVPARRPSLYDLLVYVLPGMINIAKGDMGFVGVRPRLPAEIKALSQDWQALYLQAKLGIVSEAAVQYDTCPSDDELYMTEAYYSVRCSLRHDCKLFAKYVLRLLRSIAHH